MELKTDILVDDAAKTFAEIDPLTRLGAVHLTVADLERQIHFHQEALGFKLHWRKGPEAGLGAGGEDLFHFTEVKDAPRVHKTTGLYHTAVLVPTKLMLAQLLARIAETRTPIQGMTNHRTHLAIYLPDAEGNGLELAWDFPREKWPMSDGKLSFQSGPLDADDLFAELERSPRAWSGLDAQTKVGHVHLHVADFDATRRFYHDILGFNLIVASKAYRALFVSAGGYHHHIGLNLWNGAGAPPPPAGAQGLRSFTVYQPTAQALDAVRQRLDAETIRIEDQPDGFLVRDPAQNGLLFKIDPRTTRE
jgi:catechol 2,3-dioxygenase